jgi:hypothetical protein
MSRLETPRDPDTPLSGIIKTSAHGAKSSLFESFEYEQRRSRVDSLFCRDLMFGLTISALCEALYST